MLSRNDAVEKGERARPRGTQCIGMALVQAILTGVGLLVL